MFFHVFWQESTSLSGCLSVMVSSLAWNLSQSLSAVSGSSSGIDITAFFLNLDLVILASP